MKDALGHGSNPRGAPQEAAFKEKANWLAGAMAQMRAHYSGGAITEDAHATKIRNLPTAMDRAEAAIRDAFSGEPGRAGSSFGPRTPSVNRTSEPAAIKRGR